MRTDVDDDADDDAEDEDRDAYEDEHWGRGLRMNIFHVLIFIYSKCFEKWEAAKRDCKNMCLRIFNWLREKGKQNMISRLQCPVFFPLSRVGLHSSRHKLS